MALAQNPRQKAAIPAANVLNVSETRLYKENIVNAHLIQRMMSGSNWLANFVQDEQTTGSGKFAFRVLNHISGGGLQASYFSLISTIAELADGVRRAARAA